MDMFELFFIAVGLSMDAFAVSICKGLAMRRADLKSMGTAGLWFGGFQALMPVIGYLVGVQFKGAITAVDHWIAFGLLAVIGGNMLREALSSEEDEDGDDASMSPKTMLLLALATSIDALAVGVGFAFLDVNIAAAACFIGMVTFLLSAAGVKVGSVFGAKYKSRAEITGGAILIVMGAKILVEHLCA